MISAIRPTLPPQKSKKSSTQRILGRRIGWSHGCRTRRLSFRRPDTWGVAQDPEAVRRRRQGTWPKIRAKVKKDGGEILFADQVGIRSGLVTGRTWARRAGPPSCGGAGTGSR